MSNFANERDLIMQYNLSSLRWKKRRIVKAQDKLILRLKKELDRLNYRIRNLEYIDLDPPIQRGYKRLFVLTEDTKHNQHADFYQNILDKINTVWYSPHKSFKKPKKRRLNKWRYYRKGKEQRLLEPSDWDFHNSKNLVFTEEEKALFYPIEYYDYPAKMWRKRFVFSQPWRFVLRVRPNMLTKIQRKDPVLEQRRDYLEDIIIHNYKIQGRLLKLKGGTHKSSYMGWCGEKDKYKENPLKNKPMHEILHDYEEEKEFIN